MNRQPAIAEEVRINPPAMKFSETTTLLTLPREARSKLMNCPECCNKDEPHGVDYDV
jgi:hypothetical protein